MAIDKQVIRNYFGKLQDRSQKKIKKTVRGWVEEDEEKNKNNRSTVNKTVIAGPITDQSLFIGAFDKFDLFNDGGISPTDPRLTNYIPEQTVIQIHPKTRKPLTDTQQKNYNKMTNKILYHLKDEALSAATKNNLRSKLALNPHVYANPMQYLDYKIFEGLLKHTFVGALLDAFIRYLVGKGFKPELQLINPDQDEEKNKKEIEANQDIITKLISIDNQISQDEDTLDIPFAQKITAMITSCVAFNRGALIFDYDEDEEKTITVDGVKYPEIPNNLISAHAQDLGIIEIDPITRRLRSVQWRYGYNQQIKKKDMIYLWNPITSAKVHNSNFYGISILSPLIAPTKLLRQIISDDFPAMAKTTWAGLYLLVVKNDKNTQASKMEEYAALANNMPLGKTSVLIKDPEDVELHDINFDPKIEEFKNLFESMVKLCISTLGLPQVGFYDESAANMATMVAKLQLTMHTTIEPMREWIGEAISDQWYGRWLKLLYKDKPEILAKFKIKLSWSDLHILDWYDNIEAVSTLNEMAGGTLKKEAIGELVGLDNYTNMLDPKAEAENIANEKKSSMTNENGDTISIKKKRGGVGRSASGGGSPVGKR